MTYVDRGQQLAEQNAMAEREIRQLAAQQGRIDPALLVELRREVPDPTIAAIGTAQRQLDAARSALQFARQPVSLVGTAQERAIAQLTQNQVVADAQAAFDRAQSAVEAAQRAYEQAIRAAASRQLAWAEAAASRCRSALQAKVGGAWNALQANALLASDPAIATLIAEERAAADRVAVLAKAIQQLYS